MTRAGGALYAERMTPKILVFAGSIRSGLPPSFLTRLIQSIVFLSSGGSEELYSGVTTRMPSWATNRRASFTAFSGTPFSSSRSSFISGSG